jgi:hypothetical protein
MRRLRHAAAAVLVSAGLGRVAIAAPGDAPAAAAPAAEAPKAPAQVEAPADTDSRMDSGLERANAKDFVEAARIFYGLYAALPESDLRKDAAGFHLAEALVAAGYVQAGFEHYLEVISGRHSPEFMAKALEGVKPLVEGHRVDEDRFVGGTIYGASYTEAAPDVADFVEYWQALTDVRRGYGEWGRRRLGALAQANRPYAFHARYALIVDRIARREDDVAAKELRELMASSGPVPAEVRNEARLALARILYEKKAYGEAWRFYSQVESSLPLQDLVMLEKAWDRTAAGDEQRALGLLVGLGAPVFHSVFAPERDLIRAMALRRLCQYRAAHEAVRDFRAAFGPVLHKIRDRVPIADDPTVRGWAVAGTKSLEKRQHVRDALARERGALGAIHDKALHDHLDAIYAVGLANADLALSRELGDAVDHVADELLRVDEQVSLIDYEIGAGLFTSGENAGASHSMRPEDVPTGSSQVYFRFDGEYWSDEVREYTVLAEDRCVR